jgi:SnoaL-like polyketide cyclase
MTATKEHEMTEDPAATADLPAWSVEMFAGFWANPDPALVPPVLTEDVVGHWPGRDEPARGRDEYTRCIAAIVEALPDMRLEVAEHARNGEFVFVRWVLHATGDHGPFDLAGMDRVRTRGPQVAENVIVFDTAAFEARSGMPVPWAQ